MKCAICELRKPRRYCPGVRGEICTLCCGTERENTVDCPFDCVYLREARIREKPKDMEELASIPFADIRVPSRFLEEHAELAEMVGRTFVDVVFSTPAAIDYDVREAFESLIRTYKTLQSGLIYETRPANPIAANIYELFRNRIGELRKEIASKTGVSVRDAEIMATLLILQRQEYRYNNGRKRGRAFIDHLREFWVPRSEDLAPSAAPLIV